MRQLCEADTGRVLVPHLTVASTLWSRAVGLLGRATLPADEGLLLTPCNGVHTFGMRFSIDVVYLDREGRVLRLISEVKPGRLCAPERGARAVLELPAGAALRLGLRQGLRYEVR